MVPVGHGERSTMATGGVSSDNGEAVVVVVVPFCETLPVAVDIGEVGCDGKASILLLPGPSPPSHGLECKGLEPIFGIVSPESCDGMVER